MSQADERVPTPNDTLPPPAPQPEQQAVTPQPQQQTATPQPDQQVVTPQLHHQAAGPQDRATTSASEQSNAAGKQEWNSTWLGGIALIVVGGVFLLQNITGGWFDNWWALFIAVPGVLALMSAWRMYEQNGNRIDARVAGAVMGGAFPLLVAAIFLLNLDWGTFWPLFLIIAGVGTLLPRLAAESGTTR